MMRNANHRDALCRRIAYASYPDKPCRTPLDRRGDGGPHSYRVAIYMVISKPKRMSV